MKLEELRIYQLAMEIGEIIWVHVQKWDYFFYPVNYRNKNIYTSRINKIFHGAGDTIGKQLVKAVDSVAANLSEGFGRYFYVKDISMR